MLHWTPSSHSETRLIEAVSIALSKHDDLMEFLFDPSRPQLRATPDQLVRESSGFSSGERLLIRIALDLWNASGEVKIGDLLKVLDQENFENVLVALQYLGADTPC